MKVLITGANGLLGQKLVSLLTPDHDVIATGKGPNRNPVGNYDYVNLDILDDQEIEKVFTKHHPDTIIHTAAMTNVDQCESDVDLCRKLNVEAVRKISEVSVSINAHLIHLSTDFIFDGESGPYVEEDEANPISKYGESKLESERILENSGGKYAIVRTVLVYGISHDMSRSNIILWVKKNLEDDKQINIVNDQWRSPTLAEDLADGCRLIMEKEACGVFNIAGKDILTPYDMAIETAEFFKLNKSLINEVDGSVFQQPAKRPPKTGLILDKAIRELDFSPRPFNEGLKILASQL